MRPAGVRLNVTRGWTRGRREGRPEPQVPLRQHPPRGVRQPGEQPHQPSADVGNGAIREAQAKELFERGGPATGKLPVILVGDLNSDVKTEVKPGDGLAYRALLNAGFAERSTEQAARLLPQRGRAHDPGGGKVSDFDHKVDHMMTNAPKKIKLVSSAVTGRQPANGFWDSDHAGLFSRLSSALSACRLVRRRPPVLYGEACRQATRIRSFIWSCTPATSRAPARSTRDCAAGARSGSTPAAARTWRSGWAAGSAAAVS